MGKKYFVTSDVHSFFDELIVALGEKGFDKDNKDHILCVCGDLFDRGPKTVELFEFVNELQNQDRLVYIAGNHESLLFDCMTEIYRGRVPSGHHFSNGTINKPRRQFSNIVASYLPLYS
jgi:predicted MPP superfamily phosphohydrolase